MNTTPVHLLAVALACLHSASGHGLVIDPPGRNTIWREGFQNPANHDDMGLNCGGLPNQIANGGKCGICGDPYQGPLKHEAGYSGGYANGIIGRLYKQGDTVTFTAKITANHLGYFMYKLCPANDNNIKLTQECFDRYPLSDIHGRQKISVHDALGRSSGTITTHMKLPPGLTCTQCVIQWTYITGNNIGHENTPQENFINCADVSITIEGGPQPKPTKTTEEIKRRFGGVKKYDANKKPEGYWDCDVVEPFNRGENRQKFYDTCIMGCLEVEQSRRECPSTYCRCYQLRSANDDYTESKESHEHKLVTETRPSVTTTESQKAQRATESRKETKASLSDNNKKDFGSLNRRTEGVILYDSNSVKIGRWDCDVVEPYNKPAILQKIYDWCIQVCIEAEPWHRRCPETHCKCYQISAQPTSPGNLLLPKATVWKRK